MEEEAWQGCLCGNGGGSSFWNGVLIALVVEVVSRLDVCTAVESEAVSVHDICTAVKVEIVLEHDIRA